MASFDIVNMYSNIPVNETLRIINLLLRKNKIDHNKIIEIINLLTIITEQNYFQYNNKFYSQPEGLPMGSPLSGTLANIYLNHLENTHIINNKNIYRSNIVYWQRYVDDILILFTGSQRQLDKLHHYINSISAKIKFTLENEVNNSLNFLDLTIKNLNHEHKFKIHRKMTQTDHTICSSSNHPQQQKISAYRHMLNRLNVIPMSNDDYNEELSTIKYIATKNGYSTKFIDHTNMKIKYKHTQFNLTTLNNTEDSDKKYISVEYNKNTCNIINRILHKHGYTTAYKTNHKLKTKLKTQKNIQSLDTGIYKLTCNECCKFYIGQTGRSFAQRFTEHTREIHKPHITSNFAQHLTDENHTYTDLHNNLKVLYKLSKGPTMDRLEELEIYKHKNCPMLLNDKINTRTNRIYDVILELT